MNESKKLPLIPYSCTFIDASWSQIWFAFNRCLLAEREDKLIRSRLSAQISLPFQQRGRQSLVFLSVRTGFDLFLSVKRFPPKSEVIMSAINIPGMVDVVRMHGLVPVPWDLRLDSLTPTVNDLLNLINERTVAVVLAHLFGKRCIEVDKFVSICQTNNLCFVEDCAEIFDAFEYLGHFQSDLVLFSFGVLKYFTAFGGAVGLVHDRKLYHQMNSLYGSYSVQASSEYLTKICKYTLAAVVLNVPIVMRLLVPVLKNLGVDYKTRVVDSLRGFSPGTDDVWSLIRRRPSLPLLYVVRERMKQACSQDLQVAKLKCDFVRRCLGKNVLLLPGHLSPSCHNWLFPIIVDNPEFVVQRLDTFGVDALKKTTQLTVVSDEETGLQPKNAQYFFNHVVYLPVHKNVPYKYLNKICAAVNTALSESSVQNIRTCLLKMKNQKLIAKSFDVFIWI